VNFDAVGDGTDAGPFVADGCVIEDNQFVCTLGLQTFIRLKGDALEKVCTPDQMSALRAVAADLHRANRTVAGSAPLIGPGSARDLASDAKFAAKVPALLSFLQGKVFKAGAVVPGIG
jgi:hypothetical protein